MGNLILVTGGARSGKSSYAQERAESLKGSRCFIATCPPIDGEMDKRILLHQKDRVGKGWETIEEQLDIHTVISSNKYDLYLVDCLTLWINNIVYEYEKLKKACSEEIIIEKCNQLISTIQKTEAEVIMVTNEVGMSIVPENAAARLFRDLVGRCNQIIGRVADEVVIVHCGVALQIK